MFFQTLARRAGLVLSLLASIFLGACDQFEEAEFRVVANNINSPDPVSVYVAGQQVGTVSLGNATEFTVSLPIPNTVGGTGPSQRRQCFPISGSIPKKSIASRSVSVCAREDQITTADFEIDRGTLELRAQAR